MTLYHIQVHQFVYLLNLLILSQLNYNQQKSLPFPKFRSYMLALIYLFELLVYLFLLEFDLFHHFSFQQVLDKNISLHYSHILPTLTNSQLSNLLLNLLYNIICNLNNDNKYISFSDLHYLCKSLCYYNLDI